jgi:hypothetical protein
MYVENRTQDGKQVVDKNRKPIRDRIIQWEDDGEMQGKDRTWSLGERTRNVTLKQIRLRMASKDKEFKDKVEQEKSRVDKQVQIVGEK